MKVRSTWAKVTQRMGAQNTQQAAGTHSKKQLKSKPGPTGGTRWTNAELSFSVHSNFTHNSPLSAVCYVTKVYFKDFYPLHWVPSRCSLSLYAF